MSLKKYAEKGLNLVKQDSGEENFLKDIKDEYDIDVRRVDERTQINTDVRKFFYKPGCKVCKQWRQVVQEANFYLDPGARIDMVNVKSRSGEAERFNVDSAPTLMIDGIKVMGASSEAGSAGFIKGLLGDEMRYGGINPNDYIQ